MTSAYDRFSCSGPGWICDVPGPWGWSEDVYSILKKTTLKLRHAKQTPTADFPLSSQRDPESFNFLLILLMRQPALLLRFNKPVLRFNKPVCIALCRRHSQQFHATMSREGSPGQPRRFAPLSPTYLGNECDARPKLRGVVFDVDGTLCT
jgi:hypothetical protein